MSTPTSKDAGRNPRKDDARRDPADANRKMGAGYGLKSPEHVRARAKVGDDGPSKDAGVGSMKPLAADPHGPGSGVGTGACEGVRAQFDKYPQQQGELRRVADRR
jgi:hypothetical protein